MLTTAEAAEILGVTRERVQQLCRSGQLLARRFGREWAVSPPSVRRRKKSPPGPGRPKNGR